MKGNSGLVPAIAQGSQLASGASSMVVTMPCEMNDAKYRPLRLTQVGNAARFQPLYARSKLTSWRPLPAICPCIR